ncbi:MAG: UDP-glucose 4-epimerase GalE [Proteobacteria bacterium]|nr:UDP-glucose 4-epimerase GalE [Pseudomonadota bacterium]
MILVIGGAGYIGSHMVKELISHGREVVILDNLTTGHRESVPDGEFIKGDLGDENLLQRIFKTYPIHTVMHFAAFSLVGESVQFPLKYFENNVSKTITLLKVMLEHGIKRFIFSSSASVYGEPEEIPITENCSVRPASPYGASKLMVEDILQECDKAHGLRYISLRYFNAAGADETGTIGENHNPESHLIPLVLKAAKGEKKNITVFGTDYPTKDGTCIRDYIHVTDLAQAHLLAMDVLENGESSNIYNLGNSHGYSVKEVIETARQVTGLQIPVKEGPRRPGDPAILVASSEKIKKELGWQPRYQDLKTIVKTAWKWHSNSY